MSESRSPLTLDPEIVKSVFKTEVQPTKEFADEMGMYVSRTLNIRYNIKIYKNRF